MRAAVVIAPNKIEIQNVPNPIIGDYDVLCQILACAVCSGTDNHLLRNHPYFKLKFPTIIGHEAIGQIISCGPKVKNFKTGDLITRIVNRLPDNSGYHLYHGAFAEKGIATDWQAMAEDGFKKQAYQKHKIHQVLPASFDPIEATMIITWRETYSFLKRINPQPGDRILIIGSGANALAFANHAINLGLEVIIIGSPSKEQEFKKLGVKSYISYKQNDFQNLIKEKVDIILDAVGDHITLNKTLPLLNKQGKIGVFGLNSFLDYSIKPTLVKGDYTYYHGEDYDEASAHDEVISFIQRGKLNPWFYLDKNHIYSLDKIQQALDATHQRLTFKSVIKF